MIRWIEPEIVQKKIYIIAFRLTIRKIEVNRYL